MSNPIKSLTKKEWGSMDWFPANHCDIQCFIGKLWFVWLY